MSEANNDMTIDIKKRARSNLDVALGAVVALSAAALIWSTFQLWSNKKALEQARYQDLQAANLIAEVRHLRSLPAIVEEQAIREDRVLGLVSDCLSQSGINPSVIRDVSSESLPGGGFAGANPGGGGANYCRQNIRAQLDSLGVPEIGRFLATWSKLHPNWIPTTVNLSPTSKNAGSKSDDGSVLWTATIVLTSTYLSTPSGIPPTSEVLAQPPSPGAKRGILPPEKPTR
ncbi:MAG: hypothetical protein KF691_03445 [Phycisphaeraceae bacterium]|nr:hypothetical protein [Phycisphaeraceae bacterium]